MDISDLLLLYDHVGGLYKPSEVLRTPLADSELVLGGQPLELLLFFEFLGVQPISLKPLPVFGPLLAEKDVQIHLSFLSEALEALFVYLGNHFAVSYLSLDHQLLLFIVMVPMSCLDEIEKRIFQRNRQIEHYAEG